LLAWGIVQPLQPRRRRARAAAFAGAALVLLALALAGAWWALRPAPTGAHPHPTASAASQGGGPRVGSPDASPTGSTKTPAVRLLIPAIGVDAPIEKVGVDAEGRMATPSRPDHVAWFAPGAAPGDAGNAVIDGHLDWTNGPAVFWHLDQLHPGDEVVVVRADGSRLRFLVGRSAQYPFDAAPPGLFTHVGPPGVALVTCSGDWDRARSTYLTRLVVFATLAPTTPSTTPGDEGG
jgi:hypothetical protein